MYLPMQDILKERLGEDGKECQSAVLKLQKFSAIPDDGTPLKMRELEAFCENIESGKRFLPSQAELSLPVRKSGLKMTSFLKII